VSLDIHDDPVLQLQQIARLEKRLLKENKQVQKVVIVADNDGSVGLSVRAI
jgi:hypothetical protein